MARPSEDNQAGMTGTDSGNPTVKNEDSPRHATVLPSAHDRARVVLPKQSPQNNPVSVEENTDQETVNDVTGGNVGNTLAAGEDDRNRSELDAGSVDENADPPPEQVLENGVAAGNAVSTRAAGEGDQSGSEIGAIGGAIANRATNPPRQIVQRKSSRKRARRAKQSRRKLGRKLKPSTQENANSSTPLESSIGSTGAARLTPAVQRNESLEEVSRDVDAMQAQEATHIRVETHAGLGVVASPHALSVSSDSPGLLASTVNRMEPGGSTQQHLRNSEVTAHQVTDVVTERREDHRLYVRRVLALSTGAPPIRILLEPRGVRGLPDNVFIDMVNHHPLWWPAVQDLAYPEEIDLHPPGQEQEETAEVFLRPNSAAFSKVF